MVRLAWFMSMPTPTSMTTCLARRSPHGTPFRRAVEEGLLDGDRVVQIGVRGTGYAADDFDWSRQQGFRVVQVEECWHTSLEPLMVDVREKVGGGPVYLSFDIDGLDPAYAPGTGTLEIGGLTTPQGIEVHPWLLRPRHRRLRSCRGCAHLRRVGDDVANRRRPHLRDAVRAARSGSGESDIPQNSLRCAETIYLIEEKLIGVDTPKSVC